MDPDGDLLNETFDFLIDEDKENESADQEVFIGPVGIKEKCRNNWAKDMQAGLEFEDMASQLCVKDWCEIFVNANIVASTLTNSAKKRLEEQEEQRPVLGPDNEPLISAPPASPNESFRRSTFTLTEAQLLTTPEVTKESRDRVSAVSDTSSYHTAQSSFSSPNYEMDSTESDTFMVATTPVNRLSLERPSTPPTLVKESRRSFLPTPSRNPESRPPRRRSLSCEERVVKPAVTEKTEVSATTTLLRPARSDASLANTKKPPATSRLKAPAPLTNRTTGLRLPVPVPRPGTSASRLQAPSFRPSKIPAAPKPPN